MSNICTEIVLLTASRGNYDDDDDDDYDDDRAGGTYNHNLNAGLISEWAFRPGSNKNYNRTSHCKVIHVIMQTV